ncbi:MAG TPA: glycosyltransferase family 2 protein [bacterium]|nr:glycosyltransferase family 2 protein [bacterium]
MPDSSNIKLTVAIPTYNRAGYLRQALDSVINQLDGIGEKIEIIISDHGCVDETPHVMEEYKKKYPDLITCYKNVEKIDSYRKFDAFIIKAKGDYVWLLADDDMLEKGAIKKVLDVIRNHGDVAWIFVNYTRYDADMKKKCGMVIKIPEDRYCSSGEEFFRVTRFTNTTFSANIVRKRGWEKDNFGKYLDISALHAQTVLPIYTLKNQPAYVVSSPLVRFRNPAEGKPGWMKSPDQYLTLGIKMLYAFIDALKKNGYSKGLVRILIKGFRKGIIQQMISLKMNDVSFSREALSLVHGFYRVSVPLFLVLVTFLHIPAAFFTAARRIHKNKAMKKVMKVPVKLLWEDKFPTAE